MDFLLYSFFEKGTQSGFIKTSSHKSSVLCVLKNKCSAGNCAVFFFVVVVVSARISFLRCFLSSAKAYLMNELHKH